MAEEIAIQAKEKGKNTFFTFKKALLALFFGIACIVAYFFWQYIDRPAVGEIRVKSAEKNTEFDTGREVSLYTGRWISFSVRGRYEEKTHEISQDLPVRESILLSLPSQSGDKVAVVVEKRERGEFSESPSYQKRVLETGTYQKDSFSLENISGTVFSSSSGPVFEETAFFRQGAFIVSISLTSVTDREALRERLFQILESVTWKG